MSIRLLSSHMGKTDRNLSAYYVPFMCNSYW